MSNNKLESKSIIITTGEHFIDGKLKVYKNWTPTCVLLNITLN